MPDDPVPSPRVSETEWYTADLGGFGGRVESVIPRSYPAYARVLHPALDEDGRLVPWSEVASWSSTVLHPRAQFAAIAGRRGYEPREGVGWPGANPWAGSLDLAQLRALCDPLAGHTTTPQRCWLTVWDGYGNLPDHWRRTVPRVEQPDRAYYLFEASLFDVVEFSRRLERVGGIQHPPPSSLARLPGGASVNAPGESPGPPAPEFGLLQSPNQWWPQDRAWCVASEIDFDSTVVGGSEQLIGEVKAYPRLEAFSLAVTDDLTSDSINPSPMPR